jgi:Peptidase family M48/PDZ domain
MANNNNNCYSVAQKIITILLISLTTFLSGCMGPTTQRVKPNDASVEIEANKQKEIALQETLRSRARLHNTGYPILKAGLPLCIDRKSQYIGIQYATKHDYEKEFQDVAINHLDLDSTLKIINVVKSSPAEIAGLQKGDVLLSVNNIDAPVDEKAKEKLSEIIKKETKDNKNISFRIIRDGIHETINVTTEEVCDYPLVISGEGVVNAYADGNNIFITQGMMDFTDTDNELALVIGHELAHNSMRHINAQRLNAIGGFLIDILFIALTGVDTQGAFSKIAAGAYSQEFESEADYVGLYFVELAGYEIKDAAYFWRRMGVKHPGSIAKNHAASHPSPPERFVSIEDTIKEINQKKETGGDLMPNIDEGALVERETPPESQVPAFSI